MRIIGYHIFNRKDFLTDLPYIKLRQHFKEGARVRRIDGTENLNGYKPFVDELDIDFKEQRLMLVIER